MPHYGVAIPLLSNQCSEQAIDVNLVNFITQY